MLTLGLGLGLMVWVRSGLRLGLGLMVWVRSELGFRTGLSKAILTLTLVQTLMSVGNWSEPHSCPAAAPPGGPEAHMTGAGGH